MERSVIKTPAAAERFADASRTWWPLLLAVGCFLLARPYEGYVHDARLYVGFALAPLDPSGIGADLLFQDDRQSGRSLFPVLLRALSVMGGPSNAAWLITVASLALWFSGVWSMVRRMWGDLAERHVAAFVIIATTLHTYYGGSTTFHFAEPFASPRVLAEACVLWSIAQALATRWWLAAGWGVLAAMIHPLMTVAGVVVVGWMLLPVRWRTIALATAGMGVAAAVALALGSGGALPLLSRFDAEWMRVLDDMGALVFLRNWEPLDWARIVVHACTIAMAWPLLAGAARRVATGTVLAAGAGLLLTWVGADWARIQLITQAQPWRALWLVALLSGLHLGVVIREVQNARMAPYADERGYRRVAGLLLLLSWYMLATSTSAATLALLALLLWWLPALRPSLRLAPRIPVLVELATPLVLFAMACAEAAVIWEVYASSPNADLLWHWPTAVLAGVPRLLGVGIAWWLLRQHAGPPLPSASAPASAGRHGLLATVTVVAAVLVFDARTAFERTLEEQLDRQVQDRGGGHGVIGPLGGPAGVSADAMLLDGPVFWPDGEMEPWAFFGRAGYGSIIQGTPRVFSRPLALQWAARQQRLAALDLRPRDAHFRRALDRLYADDPGGIRALCAPPDAPGSVALTRRPAWASSATSIRLPVPQLLPGQTPGAPWEVREELFLVSCRQIRTLFPA